MSISKDGNEMAAAIDAGKRREIELLHEKERLLRFVRKVSRMSDPSGMPAIMRMFTLDNLQSEAKKILKEHGE